MLFSSNTLPLSPTTVQFTLHEDRQPLTFTQVVQHWISTPAFRDFYTDLVLEHGDVGCFWEHPRLHQGTAGKPYECVITRTAAFGRYAANFAPFQRAVQAGARISVFPNLNGEALLIVPNKTIAGAFNGRDLVAFLQTAPADLIHELWQTIGLQVEDALAEGSRFQFLSTHGLGVLWLHVRLEERPKYYHHRAYRMGGE
ncbi:MAG: hypothetical protein AAF840_07770 [Bacteroidota bacterium]